MVRVACALFSRWSQENFFKCMLQEFNLDASPTHALGPVDPDAQVVNPVRREIEKNIRRLRSRTGGMHARVRRAREPQERQSELAGPDRFMDDFKATGKSLPAQIRAAVLPEDELLHTLPVN